MATAEKNIILTSQQIQQKIKRIAYQILREQQQRKRDCYWQELHLTAFYSQKR